MIGTSIGVLVFLLFLFIAVQVLFGLYATSTLRATVTDAATRAASRGGASPGELERIMGEAEASLGDIGRRPTTVIELELVDEDGDGAADVVVGRARAVPPRFAPGAIGPLVGGEQVTAGARVRIERPR